jgi:hypothetical protein
MKNLRNQVVSFLIWLWWVIDLAMFEFEFRIVLFCFSFIFVLFGESRLLVSWCAGGRCDMVCSDEDHSRSRRPGAEDRGWSHRSGTRWPDDRGVGWRRVWYAPWTWRWGARVYWLSLKTKVDGLWVVWPQNHSDGFSPVWPQNRWRLFLEVWPQNLLWRFVSDLASKPLGRFLPVWPQNRWRRFLSV